MLIIGLIIRGGDSFGHSIQSVTRGDIQVPDWLLPYLISTFVVPLTLSSLGLLFFCLLFPLNSQLPCTPVKWVGSNGFGLGSHWIRVKNLLD